jgi:hypothetical protein
MGDKVGYAIVKEEPTIEKKILPQNTVFSAEQSAIIEEIQSKKNKRHEIVIITDSVSTIMAAENRTLTKQPKTQTIRKMLDHEGPRIMVPSQRIPGNEKANQAAKEVYLNYRECERYPQDDQKVRPKMENGNNEMNERMPSVDIKEDTKGIPRKDRVAISRLRTR